MELMGNPDFQDGHKLTIGWLQGRADEYETRPHSSDGPVALMSVALYRFDKELMEIQLEHARALEEGRSYPSDKLLNEKSFDLPFAQREYKISVKKLEQGLYAVTCGGVTIVAHWVNTGRGYLLTTNQQSHKVNISGDKDTLKVQLNGHLYEGIAHDPQKIKSAMTGSMWKVYVSPGDRVRVGDPIVNIEAMKMENVVVSEIDAKVKSVHVQSGDRVSPGGMMVELEPLDPNLVVEAKQAAIQLDSAGHVPLFDAEGLEKYLDKFSWEDRQKMLLGFIQGGGFFADSLIAVKGKKSPTQESTKKTSLSVILDAYRSEAALLEGEWKKLTKDDQDKILHAKHADLPEVLQTLSGKIRAHVSRIHDLLEQFLKLETPFQKLGDSFYTQNKDKAYQEALRRKNISIHIQTLMTLLRQVRDLPYHIKTHERSLVSYLAQMSQFKGEEFKGLRSLSRDLYRIANPRSQDNFNTSERVRQAAAAIDRDRREPLVESLLSAPILSATELVNLMQDSDENVRSVAAHVLLHRTYEGVRGDSQRTKRHQIVKGSFSVKDLEDGGLLSLGVYR
ncbi:MAG: acetyl-CoA carboxylase biotin carboxyl carrier protein subunit [Deltaproteobacteria bacterium]|nr:MAG: acetyl-CoA carboxylase biotin carboxyl carrier protein subunit [Deltaproteobacteria bacterium]